MRDISKLHWIKKTDFNKYEMILDHQMLSTWRMCQAHFELTHIQGRKTKGRDFWFLEFGWLLHKIIEDIYTWKQEGTFTEDRLSEHASQLWFEADMDRFEMHLGYKALGGRYGFIALCFQYVMYYTQDTERIRIIGTEISFGSKKEVPLGAFSIGDIIVNCFLSGRIDFLGDDGRKIGPVDHKTRGQFRGDLGATYNPHEGMSGYIYATRHIIKTHFPELSEKRALNTAWMNFILVPSQPDPLKRFSRALIMRTDYQLEEFRLRQIETIRNIFNYLNEERKAEWNTEVCTHWYGNDCIYRKVHRQPDETSQLIVLNADFDKEIYWNPEKLEESKNGARVAEKQNQPV